MLITLKGQCHQKHTKFKYTVLLVLNRGPLTGSRVYLLVILIFSKFSSYYSDKNQRNSVSSFYIKIAFILNVIIYSTLHTSSVVNCALFAVANTGC